VAPGLVDKRREVNKSQKGGGRRNPLGPAEKSPTFYCFLKISCLENKNEA
jgi:hypothetical protein